MPFTFPRVIRVGHVVLSVADLPASRHFYVDLLGLNVVHEDDRALYLRGVEDREWSLKLELGPEPGVKQLAYKAGSEAALDEIAAIAQAEGLPHRWETERDRPRILRLQDPFGFPIAFYYESVKHPWLLQRFDLHRGPGIQRIDHINVLSPHVKALSDWYQKHLDFRLTESTEDEDGRIWATWMHRKGHAHDLATTNGAGPRLHHFAYWLPDGARISQLCDILAGAFETDRIERGPGRHGITNAYFLYLARPRRSSHRALYFRLSQRRSRFRAHPLAVARSAPPSSMGRPRAQELVPRRQRRGSVRRRLGASGAVGIARPPGLRSITSMKNRSVPTETVLPHVVYRDVVEALAWLTATFGFQEHYRYGDPVSGAQMYLGNAYIMVTGPRPGSASPVQLGYGTQSLTVFVDNVDAHYDKTKSAGAKIVEELHETVYGERQYGVEDLDGHRWIFSQHARDLSPDEWGATVAPR